MKPNKWDYTYLIDQLSNSMEFYSSKDDFVHTISNETLFTPELLAKIWDNWLLLDGKTAFDNSYEDWQIFITNISKNEPKDNIN